MKGLCVKELCVCVTERSGRTEDGDRELQKSTALPHTEMGKKKNTWIRPIFSYFLKMVIDSNTDNPELNETPNLDKKCT